MDRPICVQTAAAAWASGPIHSAAHQGVGRLERCRPWVQARRRLKVPDVDAELADLAAHEECRSTGRRCRRSRQDGPDSAGRRRAARPRGIRRPVGGGGGRWPVAAASPGYAGRVFGSGLGGPCGTGRLRLPGAVRRRAAGSTHDPGFEFGDGWMSSRQPGRRLVHDAIVVTQLSSRPDEGLSKCPSHFIRAHPVVATSSWCTASGRASGFRTVHARPQYAGPRSRGAATRTLSFSGW